MSNIKCKTCGEEITKSTKVCPRCGAKNNPPIHAVLMVPVFSIIIVFLALAFMGKLDALRDISPAQMDSNGLSEQGSTETTPSTILNQDDIKVLYNGMSLKQYLPGQPEAYALYIGLTVENNSGVDVTLLPAAQETSVNDVMKTPTSAVPMSVPSGKKIITSFFFANLDGTGINSADDIGNVEHVDFKLSAYDSNFNELFTSGEITVSP